MPAITKQEFNRLFSEDITKKDYDLLMQKIDDRFNEICKKFLTIENGGWFDYCNASDKDDDFPGHFDPAYYRELIGIIGNGIKAPPGFDFEFPTRWLWEDGFLDEMKVAAEKEEERKLRAVELRKAKKKRNEELAESIRQKLTDEELKFIKFNPKRV